MTYTNNCKIAGYVGEFCFSRLLAACKINSVSFDSLHLIKVARQSSIGRERIRLAQPYLLSEYGTPIRDRDGKYQLELKWDLIPAQVILDRVYGLDAVINFRGWIIGVDITTDPEALIQKRQKLNFLAPLWKCIGIDCTAVIHLYLARGLQPEFNRGLGSDLISELRQAIKQQKQIFTLAL